MADRNTTTILKTNTATGKYQGNTGSSKSTIIMDCISLGEKCPIKNALQLKMKYYKTLSDLNICVKENSLKLRMAEFVKEIAQSAPKSSDGQISEKAVWKRMRSSQSSSSDCMSYEGSDLKADIEKLKEKINKSKEAMENAAKELISLIKSENFQKHLLKVHARKNSNNEDIDFLSAEKAMEYYDVAPEKKAKIRTIDHLTALLTEDLSATEPGMVFLGELINEKALGQLIGFADVWNYAKKGTAAGRGADVSLEATAKVLYNVAPVISAKIQKLIFDVGKNTVVDIMKDPDLKRVFDFLDKKFDIDITGWLAHRADLFGSKGAKAIANINSGKTWDNVLHVWTKDINCENGDLKLLAEQKKYDKATNKLNGAWLSITLDVIAFSIALSKITADFKKSKIKDWFSALSSLSSMTKTFADTYSAALTVRSANAAAEDAAKLGLRAKQAAIWTKGFGVAAGIFTAIVGSMEVIKGVQRRDWEVITLNLVGVGLAGAGIYATIVGATVASGVLAIAGLALAIIMALVLDPPVLDYLEDQYWSRNWKEKSKKIKLENTIKDFYKTMFNVEVRYVKTSQYDKMQSYIEIECGALADPVPIAIEIINETTKSSLGKQTIFSANTSVSEKGQIRKDVASWSQGWPFYSKRLEILKFWEIWPKIQSSSTEKYTIHVGVDSEASALTPIESMALNKTISGIIFDFFQEPILRYALTSRESFFENQKTIRLKTYLHYNSLNLVKINVFTEYASDCTFNIVSIRHNSLYPNVVMNELVNCKITGDCSFANVPVDPPPANDYYKVIFVVTLFKNGIKIKSIEHSGEILIASEEYLKKQIGTQ